MVGMAFFVFLGEVLFGTLLFWVFALFVKFWAEHEETALEQEKAAPAPKAAPKKQHL